MLQSVPVIMLNPTRALTDISWQEDSAPHPREITCPS